MKICAYHGLSEMDENRFSDEMRDMSVEDQGRPPRGSSTRRLGTKNNPTTEDTWNCQLQTNKQTIQGHPRDSENGHHEGRSAQRPQFRWVRELIYSMEAIAGQIYPSHQARHILTDIGLGKLSKPLV